MPVFVDGTGTEISAWLRHVPITFRPIARRDCGVATGVLYFASTQGQTTRWMGMQFVDTLQFLDSGGRLRTCQCSETGYHRIDLPAGEYKATSDHRLQIGTKVSTTVVVKAGTTTVTDVQLLNLYVD